MIKEGSAKKTVRVGLATCGIVGGANEVYNAFDELLGDQVELYQTGCLGMCFHEPLVEVIDEKGSFLYGSIDAEKVPRIVNEHVKGDQPIMDWVVHSAEKEGEYLSKQTRILLKNSGVINPEDIESYISVGGYEGLKRALSSMTPDEVITEIENSGLRGRGGAGFPTHLKWKFTRQPQNFPKYVVCNADEGDPGAFMDRNILESDPHAVIEGLALAGYAIGAEEGFIYVRAEYPLAVERLHIALQQAREKGFIGENILGSGFNFNLSTRLGAGSFVCGEETALLASIESRRGMPRPRPPFPAQSGLNGQPTAINNVKSLVAVSRIIGQGVDWFSSVGTEKTKGTVVFALAGKVVNSGLVEVPAGTPLSSIIYDIGGGISRGQKFKAVQTGGPSGGCIPAKYMDTPVEYERLAQLGSIMGSGGMVVMDENTCMVDIARYFVSFTQSESCGKCIPCRLGTRQMLEILTRITEGRGREGDIESLYNIAKTVKEASLCGLGQTSPNPVLTTLNYFREEYEAHIKEKRCTASSCDMMMIASCQHTCPAGIDVPTYVAAISHQEYYEAVEVIRDHNPFPAICGRICHHPCESKCRRGELDEPISIMALKRFASDWYFHNVNDLPEPKPFERTKKQKVAVVGAGPAGLTNAYFLAKLGYNVTVLEALPFAGGMLITSLPEFRLPSEVVQKEINYIEKSGVEIKYNTPVGDDYSIEDLKAEYDAVFIAAGAQKSQQIGIPGESEDLEGLYYGLGFLKDVKLDKPVKVGKKAVVIGGGNVAIDTARTAVRMGAEEVRILYRRDREAMPAQDAEVEEALEEGIQISFLVNPTAIESTGGRITGLKCVEMELGERGSDGRRRPIPVEGSEFFVEADTVFAAVGQTPDYSFLPEELQPSDGLVEDENWLSTSIPGVFVGGDFMTGPGMVIDAIAAGRRAALAIDRYFMDDPSRVITHDLEQYRPREEAYLPEEEEEEEAVEEEEDLSQPIYRVESPLLPPEERKKNFQEVVLRYSEEKCLEEANRCLRCDLEK